MDSGATANPFLALFSSEEEASRREGKAVLQKNELNHLLTRIFLFAGSDCNIDETSLKNLPRYVVQLPQFTKNEEINGRVGGLTLENISIGLAERLMLPSVDFDVLDLQSGLNGQLLYEKSNAMEPSAIVYLAECYSRAMKECRKSNIRKAERDSEEEFSEMKLQVVKECQSLIASKASIVVSTDHKKALLQTPHLKKRSDFIDLLRKTIAPGSVIPLQFFHDVAQSQNDNLDMLKSMFDGILDDLYLSKMDAQLTTSELDADLNVIDFFSCHPALSKVLTSYKHWLPERSGNGRLFEIQTILGRLLSPSSISQLPQAPSAYFPVDRPFYASEVHATTASIRDEFDQVTTRVYKIFDRLLRASEESKKALLTWIVSCLDSNKDRGKMASRLSRAFAFHQAQASDGFFVNLSWVMLRLCSPFLISDNTDSTRTARIRTIDISYVVCDKSRAAHIDSGGPLMSFSDDPKLVPISDLSETHWTPNVPFNFITHCFFLTHKCLMLGLTQVINKCQDTMRTLSHLHGVLDGMGDAVDAVPGSPLWHFRILSSQLLGIKAHAFHPFLMELCLSFYCTTAYWLVRLVVGEDDSTCVTLDKPTAPVHVIPECLVENMSNIVLALRQTDLQLTLPPQHIHHYVSFCTIYMRSAKYINNPHIRAKLAQLLQFFVKKDEESASSIVDDDVQRNQFAQHGLAKKHLLAALMSIFVDIEHTGESMEFEDKFAYRLPMYAIMEFLWTIPAYRPSIEQLSQEVISHSALTVGTPVFLRFINMIINDAILQLDEGLENLATIKQLQDLEESDEWNDLSMDQKKEHAEKLKEAQMYAANRSQLSDRTVNVLKVITNDTRQPFVIPSIVDRMAAMLNYVLKLLVGKRSKELKVRDAHKYNFDPRALVRNIVAIFLNLGEENSFCEALPRDGRSFSMDLFPQAERVLWIVSGDQDSMISEWRSLAARVKKTSDLLLLTETAFENPPDEFLDPLTQELMVDPVILPTSGHTLDKSSIMRHLLSDQQDPFNRAPLTSEMLQPDNELREKILEWKRKKLAQRAS